MKLKMKFEFNWRKLRFAFGWVVDLLGWWSLLELKESCLVFGIEGKVGVAKLLGETILGS
jgi:hypothetical protein